MPVRLATRPLVPLAMLALGAILAALPLGCGSASNVPTTVRGLVQFRGAPLAGGLIVFAPDADRGGHGQPARGEVLSDGSFQLHIDGSGNIPPGWYRVAIAEPPATPGFAPHVPDFPTRLRPPDRSNQLRHLQPGKDNHFEFLIETNHVVER